MADIDIEGILKEQPADARVPKTKIVCTLGPTSRMVLMLEKLLCPRINVLLDSTSHTAPMYTIKRLLTISRLLCTTLRSSLLSCLILRWGVCIALASDCDNLFGNKVKEFTTGFSLFREMEFTSNDVAEVSVIYYNYKYTDEALAQLINTPPKIIDQRTLQCY